MPGIRKKGVKQVAAQYPKVIRSLRPEALKTTPWLMSDTIHGALRRKKITVQDVEEFARNGDLTAETILELRRDGILK
jgi:hypothetical protein